MYAPIAYNGLKHWNRPQYHTNQIAITKAKGRGIFITIIFFNFFSHFLLVVNANFTMFFDMLILDWCRRLKGIRVEVGQKKNRFEGWSPDCLIKVLNRLYCNFSFHQ